MFGTSCDQVPTDPKHLYVMYGIPLRGTAEMAPEKGRKHETFRTWEPKLMQSLMFLTLYDGQA